jgi:hypothetical protein
MQFVRLWPPGSAAELLGNRNPCSPSSTECSRALAQTASSDRCRPLPVSVLSRSWSSWRVALKFVKPATIVSWYYKGFCLFWTGKCRGSQPGRRAVSLEVRLLIRRLSRRSPLWGAPKIHSELSKLRINISESSVSKYLVRPKASPSKS